MASKQQDLDYMLMQTCNERDKQTKLIEELTNKYLFLKNEKNDLEHLVILIDFFSFYNIKISLIDFNKKRYFNMKMNYSI